MRNRQNLWIILFVIAVVVACTVYEANRPQPVDWKTHFSVSKKSPYGTYIVRDALPYLFPQGEVKTSRYSIEERLRLKNDDHPEAYLFVNMYFEVREGALEALTEYVKEGNTLFVSAEYIQDTILSIVGAKVGRRIVRAKSYIRNFEEKAYSFQLENRYFELNPDFEGEVLGYVDAVEQPNFIRTSYGKGTIYLHTSPKAFSNFFLLDSLHGDYYQKALSFLPPDINVTWDEYQKSGSEGKDTPLRVLLEYPALRWGYFLLLLGGLLYLLFRSKREQRFIPVITPPENRTLEFVSIVSSLYYKNRDHAAIAKKRIDCFMGEVRYDYKLRMDEPGPDFNAYLSERSGVSKENVTRLMEIIVLVKKTRYVTEKELQELVKYIEMFKPNK